MLRCKLGIHKYRVIFREPFRDGCIEYLRCSICDKRKGRLDGVITILYSVNPEHYIKYWVQNGELKPKLNTPPKTRGTLESFSGKPVC